MKRTTCCTFSLTLVLTFFALVYSSNAAAEIKERGEFCLLAAEAGEPVPAGVWLRLGVLSYGNGHLVLSGKRGDISASIPAYGTAMIIDDKIVASIHTSLAGANSSTFSAIHIVIDKITFLGSATELATHTSGGSSPSQTVVQWDIVGGYFCE